MFIQLCLFSSLWFKRVYSHSKSILIRYKRFGKLYSYIYIYNIIFKLAISSEYDFTFSLGISFTSDSHQSWTFTPFVFASFDVSNALLYSIIYISWRLLHYCITCRLLTRVFHCFWEKWDIRENWKRFTAKFIYFVKKLNEIRGEILFGCEPCGILQIFISKFLILPSAWGFFFVFAKID